MKTVFFLDDDPDYLFLVKRFTENRCHCHVLTAKSFDETVRNENNILNADIAFLDINLGADSPSGVEVFRRLRAHGFDKPIYFLTGHARNSPEIKAAESLGEVKVLSKPIRPLVLQELIGTNP